MDLKQAATFLSLVGIVMCMNLKAQQTEKTDEHSNVLYFKASKQSLPDRDTDMMPNYDRSPNVMCGNSTYSCSNNYTCCPGASKTFSCCPIQRGVCCQDGQHCCPPNTYCDMIKRQCYRQNKDKLEAENWILAAHGFLQKSVSKGE